MARRIDAKGISEAPRIKYFIDFNVLALTQPVAQSTSLSLPLRRSIVPAPFVHELFLFFSGRARERSSSANGNGDRTLETISIKIFDRCETSRKLAATAMKKENGDGGERVRKT